MRNGFTLMELMVVIIIITALAAIAIPAMTGAFAGGQISGTTAVLNTVATRILSDKATNNSSLMFTYIDPSDSQPKMARKWDIDDNGILDGHPSKIFDDTWQARAAAGVDGPYKGFYGTFSLDAGDTYVNRDTGEITDAWKSPIRIKFHKTDYGQEGFLVYSLGPDRRDNTDDDILGRTKGMQ